MVGDHIYLPWKWLRSTGFATKCYQARKGESGKYLKMVDLVGIEPTTSSMPWNRQKPKLLTVKWLEDGITGKTGLIGAI